MMTWTDKAPDAPGWFWLLNGPQAKTSRPRPVQVYFDKLGRLSVCSRTLGFWKQAGMRFLWAGPIEEPPAFGKED